MLQYKPAKREAVPQLIAISSVSGGGKTYSALLLASGLAGPDGKVGMLDTENGRGQMYSDSPGIMKALPKGFLYARLDPPFTPDAFVGGIKDAAEAGVNVLVIDSWTHEWSGLGGCCDIAEKFKSKKGAKNWIKAKLAHKEALNYIMVCPMHLIFCIRAQDKVRVEKDSKGETVFVPIGLIPVTEKSFVFECLVHLQLEEKTHRVNVMKAPEPLQPFFKSGELITVGHGERIREWNSTGMPQDPHEVLTKRSRVAAEGGMEWYKSFFAGLSKEDARWLASGTIHEENKTRAADVDFEKTQAEDFTESQSEPEPPPQ